MTSFLNRTPPVMSHVRWTLVPFPDESLAGYFVRTSKHNALGNASALIRDSGLPAHQRAGELARSQRDLDGLADVLAVDRAWMRSRRHHKVAGRSNSVFSLWDFHGAWIRGAHLEYRDRLHSPGGLAISKHHRDAWHISTIGTDVETWQQLTAACGNPLCGKRLGWIHTRGPHLCESCGFDLRDSTPSIVPEPYRSSLRLGASLLSIKIEEQQAALAELPEGLRSENRGDLFELAWQLGVLDHEDHMNACVFPKLIEPAKRIRTIATGFSLLRHWPASIEHVLQATAERDPSGEATAMVVTSIRKLISRPKSFGRATTLTRDVVGAFHTNHFSTVVGVALGLWTGAKFAPAAGVGPSNVKKLREAGLLDTLMLKQREHRAMAVYSPVQAGLVRSSLRARYSAWDCARDFGVGADAVVSWSFSSLLVVHDDPVVQCLYPEMHVDGASASALRRQLDEKLVEVDDEVGQVVLRLALRRICAPSKPWTSIVRAILEGSLRVYRNRGASLRLRECRIDRSDVSVLDNLGDELTLPTAWCPALISDPDAWERLNCGSKNLRPMIAHGRLSSTGRYDGQTYFRADVDVLAARYICTTEVKARLGEFGSGRNIDRHIVRSGARLEPGGFMQRKLSRKLFGLEET